MRWRGSRATQARPQGHCRDSRRAPARTCPARLDDPDPLPKHRPPADVQAVITLLGRSDIQPERTERASDGALSRGDRLDLSRADMRNAVLERVHLEDAFLWDADLRGASCYDAHFSAPISVARRLAMPTFGKRISRTRASRTPISHAPISAAPTFAARDSQMTTARTGPNYPARRSSTPWRTARRCG